jgi:hypothetical protein
MNSNNELNENHINDINSDEESECQSLNDEFIEMCDDNCKFK